MKCKSCSSPRIINFLDGFGNKRIFCRDCEMSFLMEDLAKMREQTHMSEYW